MAKSSKLLLLLSTSLLVSCSYPAPVQSSSAAASSSSLIPSSSEPEESSSSEPSPSSSTSSEEKTSEIPSSSESSASPSSSSVATPHRIGIASGQSRLAATITGLPDTALQGASITFSFTMNAGYDFAGTVDVFTEGPNFVEEPIASTLTGQTVVFTMPDKDVFIRVNAIPKEYAVTWDTTNGLIQYVQKQGANDAYPRTISQGETLTTGTKIFVKLLKHNMDRTLTALGFDADFDDGTTQTFTYDSQAIEVAMKAAAVNFTAKSEAYERDIDIVDDDHSAVSTYALNNGTYTPKTTAVYGDTVYVKVDIADSDYALKSLVMTYNTASYPSRAMSVEIYGKDHLSGPTNGYYSFVMPDIADEENLTLTCVTKNVSTYRGADFVGTYQGVSLFNSAALSSVNVFSPQIKTVIDGSGELITGIGSSSASLLNIASASDGFACTSAAANAGFAYDDKVIYTSNSTFSMAQNVPGNNGYAYLKVAPGTLESDYAVHAELFSSNGHTYQVYQFLYQGNAYSGIFVDSLGTYHLGVTFEMITGTNINDANATYHIKENGVEIAYVDIKDSAGGQENRVIRDAYFGAYNCTDTEEWRVLVLDGLGHATYGDKTLSYTVDADGQVTATHLNVTLVANLDTTAMTYEIVSYEEIDNVLYGKKFTAVITDDRDPEWISTYYFHLNFKELANYEPRITTAASGGALMWPYSEAKVTELYPDCIYSYEGSTVTCAFFQRDTNAPITMILAMNDAGNPTKLTVTSMSATFDRTGCYPIVVGTEFNLA